MVAGRHEEQQILGLTLRGEEMTVDSNERGRGPCLLLVFHGLVYSSVQGVIHDPGPHTPLYATQTSV